MPYKADDTDLVLGLGDHGERLSPVGGQVRVRDPQPQCHVLWLVDSLGGFTCRQGKVRVTSGLLLHLGPSWGMLDVRSHYAWFLNLPGSQGCPPPLLNSSINHFLFIAIKCIPALLTHWRPQEAIQAQDSLDAKGAFVPRQVPGRERQLEQKHRSLPRGTHLYPAGPHHSSAIQTPPGVLCSPRQPTLEGSCHSLHEMGDSRTGSAGG